MSINIINTRIFELRNMTLKVSKRANMSLKTIESLIAILGETRETLELVMQFNETKIHELELLLIISNDITNSEHFKNIDNVHIKEEADDLKKTIVSTIVQTKADLSVLLKYKQVGKISISKLNKSKSTRALLGRLGLS